MFPKEMSNTRPPLHHDLQLGVNRRHVTVRIRLFPLELVVIVNIALFGLPRMKRVTVPPATNVSSKSTLMNPRHASDISVET